MKGAFGVQDRADVVVIGGGVTACSIAYHLVRRGARRVAVVEKSFLASGPTGRSSACVRQHYSTPETCRMVLHSLRFFETFEEKTSGRSAGFVRVWYLLGVDDRLRRQINLFARPPEAAASHPLVYDFVLSIYTRPEAGGLTLVGPLESEVEDRADPDRYNEGVTFAETADAMERVVHRFPVMSEATLARGYSGCFDVSPDWHPVLDESPVGGFYVAVGFSGHGFKLSPAVGDMMARLVLDGKQPTDDVHAFRLSRFAEGKPIRGTYGDWLMC